MTEVIVAASVIGGLGAIFGLGLSYASKIFAIEVDERIEKIRDELPGANCGACGFAGCDNYAEAVVEGKAKASACTVGGNPLAQKIAEILGVEAGFVDRHVAKVMCKGDCNVSKDKYVYNGIEDCAAAMQLFAGPKSCSYGCLGFGNCVRACEFNAMHIIDGVAVVDNDLCTGCEQCVAACPKNLIEMVPADKGFAVLCKSKDKGPVTRKNCDVGCIGCRLCVKACEFDSITMDGPLAKIDPYKCTNCGECEKKCPTKAIKQDAVKARVWV
jgi:electron transport complex protein RnfB